MGFARQLRAQRNADVRVLKAQLDFVAESMQVTRLAAVLWSCVLVALTTTLTGLAGNISIARGIWVPLLVTVTSLWTTRQVHLFRAETAVDLTQERIIRWQRRLVYAQAAVGCAWGLAPWLLWQSGNVVNHLFLAAATIVLYANMVVTRANHGSVVLAGLVPAGVLPALRFVTDANALDLALAVIVPAMGAQIYRDAMRMTRRMDADSRLRFQVEDLARELESTRDEALRKRFEAETANASKTAFLANMSHELRTPLNAILGFSEIIQQQSFGPAGSPRYVEYAGDIHSSGAHLLNLINDLLDVAKIEAGKLELQPRVLDARAALELALKLIGGKARERRQELSIEVEASAPPLYADERALKQILINLASNAVKFTPIGGKISVVGGPSSDGGFQIMVRDNGPGVPRDKLDKIFVPFNQVDNRYDRQAGGTGLGLALVRGLVELHGGRAWIESEPGKGCQAFVVLPPAPESHLPSMAAA